MNSVTTQQIADAADVSTGTLFLYTRSKGELFLYLQNLEYEAALDAGEAAARGEERARPAITALLAPVIRLNRAQIENGRHYLQEILYGDPSETHRAEAIEILGRLTEVMSQRIAADGLPHAEARARLITAGLIVELSSPGAADGTHARVAEAVALALSE